jgi:hypothetical protein
MHATGFFHAGDKGIHSRAVSFEVSHAFFGNRMRFLRTVADADRHMAEFFKQGQRRVDNARARAVSAANLFLDCLDDFVTVPGLLGDQIENDQAKIAMGEETAKTETVAAAMTMPVSAVAVVLAGFSAGVTPVMMGMGDVGVYGTLLLRVSLDITK